MDQPGDGRAVPGYSDPTSVVSATATDERAGQTAGGDVAERRGSRANGAGAAGESDRAGSKGRNGASPAAPPPLAPSAGSWAKRALDLTVAIGGLPLALLVGAVIALLVKVTSRGPVFFVQERVGLGGRRFRMIKFRTMLDGAEDRLRRDPGLWDEYVRNGYKLPASVDTRVTPIGRFLRRSSLDELPQLVNVLSGHMSLVGPRPVVPDELANYGDRPDVYLGVKPGLTGWWQVNGRSGVGYPERVELDRYYAESWTLWLDVRILFRTPFTLLRGGGAY
jgi:exopolysaccharide production protein ExoY